MAYKNRDSQREFARKWRLARREEWFSNNGPCRRCWSTEKLRVYYPDISDKVEHRLWSWKKDRRDEELRKCVVLCQECWFMVRNYIHISQRKHGTVLMYDKGGCRCQPCRDAHAAKMRLFRGKNMGLSSAIGELLVIKNNLYNDLDRITKSMEAIQTKISDIDNAIRVLKSLNGGSHAPVASPEPVVEENPVPVEEPVVEEEMEAEQQVDSNPPQYSPAVHRRGRRPANATPVYIPPRPSKEVRVEPLAGASSVLSLDYVCERCRAKFMSQAALDKHNEERHTRSEIENRCPVTTCRKNFQSQTEMENHVIHSHPKFAKECGYA